MKEQPSPPPPLPLPPPSPAAAAAAGCVVVDGGCSGAPAEDSPAPAQPQRKRHPTRCRHCHRDCIYFRSRSSAFLLFSNSTVFVVKMSGQESAKSTQLYQVHLIWLNIAVAYNSIHTSHYLCSTGFESVILDKDENVSQKFLTRLRIVLALSAQRKFRFESCRFQLPNVFTVRALRGDSCELIVGRHSFKAATS